MSDGVTCVCILLIGLLSITELSLVLWYISYVLSEAAPTRSKETKLERAYFSQ